MIPLYLLLENFMSHARSELDFSQFDMALIIGMENDDPDTSNGIGKTALFDAIRWNFYGKCRFRVKKRVIQRGKVACSVTFVFQLQNETYKIVRKMSQRAASNEVSLLVKDGDNWRDLSCDTATGTGEKIEKLIKLGHDTFVNSLYFKQNDILQFASATSSQKKDILKESLQIEIWDKYQDRAKDIARRLSVQLSALDDRIRLFGDLDRDIAINKTAMEGLTKKIKEAQDKIAKHICELDEARIEASNLVKTNSESVVERIKAIMARAAVIKERKQVIVSELSNYRKLMVKAQDDQDLMKERLLEFAHQVLVVSTHPEKPKAEKIFKRLASSRKLPSFAVFCDKLAQDKIIFGEHKRKADDAALELRQLLALEPGKGKKCPTCLSVIADPDKVLQQRKKRTKFLENTKREAETVAEELLRTIVRQEKVITKANSAAPQLGHMEFALSQAEEQAAQRSLWCTSLEEELRNLAAEWKSLKEEKARLQVEEDEDAIKVNRLRIKELEDKLETLRRNLVGMSMEYGNLQGHAEDLECRLSECNTLITRKPAIAKELDIYNQLIKAFGKNGVPAIIMENVTDDLRNYANDILKRISDKPMSVDFVTQKRMESGSWSEIFDISVTIDDETNEFEDLSGGEQVRVAIAVRLALSEVLMRRMGSSIRFLLLDEVDEALDRRGVQTLADTLRILSKEFKILVITHNDAMKERFDHIITVQKGPAGSFLRQ
jgi:exonuclease SbcC